MTKTVQNLAKIFFRKNATNKNMPSTYLAAVLRTQLGTSYIITHAPEAPYFMGTTQYPSGGYITVHQSAGIHNIL